MPINSNTTAQVDILNALVLSPELNAIVTELESLNFRKLTPTAIEGAINNSSLLQDLNILIEQIRLLLAPIESAPPISDILTSIQNLIPNDLIAKLQLILNNTSALVANDSLLGVATKSQSKSVSIASDQIVPVSFTSDKIIGSVTSSFIAIGGVPRLIPPDLNRTYFEIQNTSNADIRVNFGSDASSTAGIRLIPDRIWSSPSGFKMSQSISVWGALAGQEFLYLVG